MIMKCLCEITEGSASQLSTGWSGRVVHNDVETANAFHMVFHGSAQVVIALDVAHEHVVRLSVRRVKRRSDGVKRVGASRQQRDRRPLTSEFVGDGATDAFARSADEGAFADKGEVHAYSRQCVVVVI